MRRAPRSPTTETARGSEGLGPAQGRLCKARPAGLHPELSGKQTAASGSPEHSAHRALVSCADGALRLASLMPTYSTIQREMRSSVRHCATPMMKGKKKGLEGAVSVSTFSRDTRIRTTQLPNKARSRRPRR